MKLPGYLIDIMKVVLPIILDRIDKTSNQGLKK